LLVFFFQAEDGIRDRNVTGVQTCALPISSFSRAPSLCGANWGNWLCQFGSQAAITVSGAAKVLSRLPRFICGPSRYLAAGDCTSVNRKGWEFIWVGAQRMSSYAWAITAGLTVWVENVLVVWASMKMLSSSSRVMFDRSAVPVSAIGFPFVSFGD